MLSIRLVSLWCLGILLASRLTADEATEPVAKDWFPPPTITELVGLLEQWDGPAKAILVLKDNPKSKLSRYLAWIDANKVLAKSTATAKTGDEIPVETIQELVYAPFGHAMLGRIDRAMKQHDYDAALTMIAELKKLGQHSFLEQQQLVATKGKAVVDNLRSAVTTAAQGSDPDLVVVRLGDLIAAVEAKALPEDVTAAITAGWNAMVGRMTDAQRVAWQDLAKTVRLTLTWDARAPEYLAEAKTAFGEQDWPKTCAGFAKAAKAHAAFAEEDYVAYGTALIETGKQDAARDVFWRMQEETRAKPDLRELFVKAGMMAPPFAPELLVLSWVGGKDDQALNEVTFEADGTIIAKGSSGLTVKYSADGAKLLGVGGDLNALCDAKVLRNYAVQKTKTNPFDGTEWQYGYKQVHSILQQPYLLSPHEWHWWKWWHSICQPKALMADSRCVELWFPNPTHFLVWVWSDGGNSTIDRDPRDLDKGNATTQGQYFGGGTKIMRGVQQTGEPLNGWNFPGRPADAVMDAYGNLYVAGLPRSKVERKLFHDGDGVTIFNPDLGIEMATCFGNVKLLGLNVRGNILVVVGAVGNKAYTTTKRDQVTKHPAVSPKDAIQAYNPAQDQPGGDGDAFIAIVRLWPQGGTPASE